MTEQRKEIIGTFTAITLLGLLIGAWELVVTRHASVLFFYDLAYLILAVCLFGIGVGALAAARWGQIIAFPIVVAIGVISIPFVAIPLFFLEAAWWSCLFALPFALFGFASTQAYHRVRENDLTHGLYAAEVMSVLIGLALLGPMLILPYLPLNVLGDMGITTHLRETVQREGLVRHSWQTSPYARTDFAWTGNDNVAYAYTDGMFVTRSVKWDGRTSTFEDPEIERLATLKRLAFRTSSLNDVALLGAGAGFDISVALQEGATSIDAVEVNEATIDFAHSLEDWAGAPLANPGVEVHIAEARRFMEQSTKQYDHINLTLLQTSPASGRARHHVDARVLTREAIQTYLSRLRPGGTLSIIQNSEALAQKTAATVKASAGDGKLHIITSLQLPESDRYNPFSYLLLVSKLPIAADYNNKLSDQRRQSSAVLLPPNSNAAIATDNQPFFFEADSPYLYQPMLVLGGVLLLTGVLITSNRHQLHHRQVSLSGFLIGSAAMCFQVLVLYQTQSALGHPVLSLSLSLSALIAGAALGALILGRRLQANWRLSVILAATAILGFTLIGSTITTEALTLDLWPAAGLIGSIIFLCAIPLGLPFLALLDQSQKLNAPGHSEGVVIGYDGLGGIAGVALGSLLAMLIGFSAVGWAAALLFTLAMLVIRG